MTDSLARMLEGPDAEIDRLAGEVLTLRALVRRVMAPMVWCAHGTGDQHWLDLGCERTRIPITPDETDLLVAITVTEEAADGR